MVVLLAGMLLSLTGCGEHGHSVVGPKVQQSATPAPDSVGGIDRPGVGPERLASDPRTALIREGYYSVDRHYDGRYTQTYRGYATSNWSYMLSDPNAYSYIKSWYGTSYASIWTGWPSYFSNMDVYSRTNLNRFGVAQSDVLSHGGQCRGWVNLLTFRSATFQQQLPAYEHCPWGYRSYSQILPGDVIETTWKNGHTALVVAVLSGTSGKSVTSVRVIDSNWIGDEVIGMHTISVTYRGGVSDLRSYHALNLPLK